MFDRVKPSKYPPGGTCSRNAAASERASLIATASLGAVSLDSSPKNSARAQGLDRLGYRYEVSKLQGQPINAATELLPRVPRVAALLKRWLLGTHQGAIVPTHLDYYWDEFTFRFNRRNSQSRGKWFFRLAQQAMQVPAVPYKLLVGGTDNKYHH